MVEEIGIGRLEFMIKEKTGRHIGNVQIVTINGKGNET